MEKRLEAVLNGQEGNYLVPLFWQHGEEEAVLRDEMQKMKAIGISEVCLEARPHPDFVGPLWWRDVDIILDEAKKLDMGVWIFDDSHFPTGYAGGRAKNAPQHLKKVHIQTHFIDAVGPLPGASFWFNLPKEQVLSIVAAKKEVDTNTLCGPMLDITDSYEDGTVYWDVPEGLWRVLIVYKDYHCGEHPDYINMLVPESVDLLIDEVYKSHYAHYADEFGKTIRGFFSDEPGFYNYSSYQGKLGRPGPLPWREGLEQELSEAFGGPVLPLLVGLWHDIGEQTSHIRYTYMDVVSRLYKTSFGDRVGAWCRAHNVSYMGHVIEDNGASTRLAYGAGHFFRALWGQDYSGIDVVLGQIFPGKTTDQIRDITGMSDGSFFHYGLAKLGSSLAHIDPKKKGRTLCELYGAYGWMEGLRLMKWLTDHMMVRGVNYCMPHSFSPMKFPDPDCPPHMYARGQNPQYRYMPLLMHYINRMCHLLNGGTHVATAAVLYHAEAEWSGETMFFHKVSEQLMKRQIDLDVIPGNSLADIVSADKGFALNQETYRVLFVPYAQYLPENLLKTLQTIAEFAPVVWVGGTPERCTEGTSAAPYLQNAKVLALDEVAAYVEQAQMANVQVADDLPDLRVMQYHLPDAEVYFFFNEHPSRALSTTVSFREHTPGAQYDAFANRLYALESRENTVLLTLAPYESVVYIAGEAVALPKAPLPTKKTPLAMTYQVSTATVAEYPAFTPYKTMTELTSLAAPGLLPRFSGTVQYEGEFSCEAEGDIWLDLGEVYESAELWINDVPCGAAICPPYRFCITGAVKPGKNSFRLHVTNTLAKQERDPLSAHFPQDPTGLLGPVTLLHRGC